MNNTSKITWMGAAIAGLGAIGDVLVHLGPDGLQYDQPTFWLGLVAAAVYAMKSYFTKGTNEPADKAGVKSE